MTFAQLRRGQTFTMDYDGSAFYCKLTHWTYRLLDLTTREPVPGMTYSLRERGVGVPVRPCQ